MRAREHTEAMLAAWAGLRVTRADLAVRRQDGAMLWQHDRNLDTLPLAEIADKRIHGTTRERPIDRFEREKEALTALGSHLSYLKVRRVKRKVRSDCRVELDTNRYSVPFQLVGQEVHLVVVAGEMTVFWHGDIVAEHTLLPGRFASCHTENCSAYSVAAEIPSTGTTTSYPRVTAPLPV